ncbi:MAG: hypothetical protein J6R23_00440 [Spirochaetales bacterium]|nr:hypothetical protein [Spirochaetales bacterium]
MSLSENLMSLVLSFIYIGIIVLSALFLYWKLKWKGESVRKFIHILTSCWIFILVYRMDNWLCMVLGPFLFIFVNGFFVYGGYGVLLGMGDRKRDNGLIYYPISLLFLVILYIKGAISSEAILTGILIMGWGDGLAALIGSRWGTHTYKIYGKYKKSIEGTLVMFAASFLVAYFFGGLSPLYSMILAFVAICLENFTPLGFDNITVPISSALLTEVLCRL